VYEQEITKEQHLAMVKGAINNDRPPLVRVHSSCLTGDVFGSFRCDCGDQLKKSLRLIAEEGNGVLLYLNQEGRGIGLVNKIRAYALQDAGRDTVQANVELGFEPDLRDYGTGAQILVHLGIKRMRLMTNNPRKMVGLEGYGLEVVDRVPIQVQPGKYNAKYLRTKHEKLGHFFDIDDLEAKRKQEWW
jgi:3,4-dihydroxy 2-butanone 4-phosphate synthase/GTP cyclohydrolase II